jgi:hypothetical protein
MALHRIVAVLLLLSSSAAAAATLNWPTLSGGGPCSGTLQACIDAAAPGDTIVIVADDPVNPDRYTAINQSVTIRKSLTLTASPGIDAVFAPGYGIVVDIDSGGPHQVTVSGLVFRQGRIDIQDNSTAAGSEFRVERVRILAPSVPYPAGCAIFFRSNSPSPQFIAGGNVISSGGTAGVDRGGICADTLSSTTVLTANVFRNRIVSGAERIMRGISIIARQGGGNIRVSGNTVLGPRLVDGIVVQRTEGAGSLSVQVDNNVVSLRDDAAGWGISVETRQANKVVVNNTVVHSRRGLRVNGFDSAPEGRVANNLVAFNDIVGVELASGALTNDYNLVFGNASNNFAPGPATVTADPLIERPSYPRPRNGSPAINAGNNADVPTLALFDADGERRVVGVGGRVDIGAFEFSFDGAASITATAANAFANQIHVTPFPVPLYPTDTLIATPRWAQWPQGASSRNLGTNQNPASPSGWALFLQQPSLSMPIGASFHVLAPFLGKDRFVHVTSATNNSGALSTMDNAATNGASNRARVLIAFHQWDGAYHDVPIGVRWVSTPGGDRWQIRNEDGSAMPTGLKFNVVAAPLLSPNAFRVTLPQNTWHLEWRLEHPLLDDNPCATPVVGRADDPDLSGDVLNPAGFGVVYVPSSGPGAPGRWVLRADTPSGPATFPAGAAFHVIVDGEQANRCRSPMPDPLFANGFE